MTRLVCRYFMRAAVILGFVAFWQNDIMQTVLWSILATIAGVAELS